MVEGKAKQRFFIFFRKCMDLHKILPCVSECLGKKCMRITQSTRNLTGLDRIDRPTVGNKEHRKV